ncbi:hypothetical protein [Undibacterium flavidum]|uniref:Uncharacterized protein n=1 Tax=Undibacterium flavidum TaxID=2762297 RepID=A0ABR6YG92_9BURK|nr:hypothetical protein [Undibacterium flavidum]MBC3875563.1 hypothetical protein [Undibacterium flavidum]
MLHKLYGFYFLSSNAEFSSKFQLEESVKKLKQKIENEKRTNSSYPRFSSDISGTKVVIESSNIPFWTNMKPQFTGKFALKNGANFLVGRFCVPTSIRLLISILLVASFYLTAIEIFRYLTIPNLKFPTETLLFLGVNHFFLFWSYLVSESDVSDISETIRSALQDN